MGASTRNIAAMRTSKGSTMGTCGERKRQAQADSHKQMCVYDNGVLRVYVCDTDLVWPGELWLLNLEVEKSRQGDGIEKPGSETDNSNEEECQTRSTG